MRALVTLIAALLFSTTTFAQRALDPKKEETRLGPIQFHVVPEIGGGIFLQDNTIQLNSNMGFFMVRLPGLVLPNFNNTSTGFQVEFSAASASGIRYTISSYSRTKLAGPMYAGGNIRIASGEGSQGSFDADVSAVVGIKLMTIGEHVPVNFEIELMENNRPVKALIIITWE